MARLRVFPVPTHLNALGAAKKSLLPELSLIIIVLMFSSQLLLFIFRICFGEVGKWLTKACHSPCLENHVCRVLLAWIHRLQNRLFSLQVSWRDSSCKDLKIVKKRSLDFFYPENLWDNLIAPIIRRASNLFSVDSLFFLRQNCFEYRNEIAIRL